MYRQIAKIIMNTNTESRIIRHWSLFSFAESFGGDISIGTCKDEAGEEFQTILFTKDGKKTMVDFGGSLEGGLSFDEMVAQVDNLQVVELETSEEVKARRIAKAKEKKREPQLETYKLCKKGDSTWQGGNLFAALRK